MSFAAGLRDELARVMPRRRCCQRAELAALVALDGRPAGDGLVVPAANAAVARKLFTLAKQAWGAAPRVSREARGRRSRYFVALPPAPAEAGFPGFPRARDAAPPTRDCCRRAYVRAMLLSRGSFADPEAGYHLEVVLDTAPQADHLRQVLAHYGVRAGLIYRKDKPVVYLKDADSIAEVLRLSGAHGSLLALEDFRVLKEMRNRINRLVNAEAANVEKTVAAAVRQLEDIRFIDETVGLGQLPPSLAEVARLRLAHPDASLADLGQLAQPPLSKSAVNHRFRRLAALAQQLRRNSTATGGK
ncbi:MAG: DNA-binding protein WhiA [Limnochordales bacterium]|nr:DNA-binding protein WhiA [Limnochordales bacterium]